jgi:hypothetical protein
MQKPKPETNGLPPPHTLIMDYTMTHIWFGSSHLHPMDQLTNTRRSDGSPDPDGALNDVHDQNQNPPLHKLILESPGPHSLYTFRCGHYRPIV